MTEKFTTWRKASRSTNSAGNCVEVAFSADATVGVRDSKAHGLGPVLEFPATEWSDFVRAMRSGTFTID